MRALIAVILSLAALSALNSVWRERRAGGRIEIEMCVWGMPFENTLYTNEYIPEFERQNPGIKVRFHHFDNYSSRILMLRAGGIAPDVMRQNTNSETQAIRRGMNLPLDRLLPEFLGAIEYMRKAIKSNARSASGVIDQYIQENYGQFLILRKTTEGIAKAFGDTDLVIDKSLARNSIKGRVENDFMPGLAQIFIEAKAIRKYANDAGFGWESFVKKLSDDKLNRSVAVVRNKTMSANTEAPPFRVDALVITRDRSDVDGLAPPSPSVAVA